MIIKKFEKKDIYELYKIGLREFKGEEWFTKKFLLDCFKRDCLGFVALEKKKLIGGILIDLLDKPKAWVFFFVIKKDMRNKGLGSNLLKESIKNLPRGYYSLFTDFEKTDVSARKFYKKQGFREVAKIKSWFGLRHYGLIYEKILKKN